MSQSDLSPSSRPAGAGAGSFEPFEADPEVKAHVYQQLTDLEKFSISASSMVVLMRKTPASKSGRSTFAVDLVVSFGASRLESSGRAHNVFEAVNRAKFEMEQQLQEVQNALISSQDREIAIQSLLYGTGRIH